MDKPVSVLVGDKKGKSYSVSPNTSVHDCIHRINDEKISALLIIDNDELHGIVTAKDILEKVVAHHLNPKDIEAADIMTESVITIRPTATAEEALYIMTERQLHYLPVFDDKKLLGVVSIRELNDQIMHHEAFEICELVNYMKNYSMSKGGSATPPLSQRL